MDRGQEELDRSEVAEQGFDVAVVEYRCRRGDCFSEAGRPAGRTSLLHLQHVGVGDVIAIAG